MWVLLSGGAFLCLASFSLYRGKKHVEAYNQAVPQAHTTRQLTEEEKEVLAYHGRWLKMHQALFIVSGSLGVTFLLIGGLLLL